MGAGSLACPLCPCGAVIQSPPHAGTATATAWLAHHVGSAREPSFELRRPISHVFLQSVTRQRETHLATSTHLSAVQSRRRAAYRVRSAGAETLVAISTRRKVSNIVNLELNLMSLLLFGNICFICGPKARRIHPQPARPAGRPWLRHSHARSRFRLNAKKDLLFRKCSAHCAVIDRP